MSAEWLSALVIYTFGAFAYGAVLADWLRGERNAGWPGDLSPPRESRGQAWRVGRADSLLMLCGFAWFLVNLILTLTSLERPAWRVWLSLTQVGLAFLFPPVILHSAYLEGVQPSDQKLGRRSLGVIVAMYLVSASTYALLLLSFTGASRLLSPGAANIYGSAVLAGLFIVAFSVSGLASHNAWRRATRPDERRSRLVMALLFGVSAVIFLPLLLLPTGTVRIGELLRLVMNTLPLVFLVVAVYLDERLAFFDVVVKRGAVLVSGMLACALWLTLMLPWIASVRPDTARPWVLAVSLLPLLGLLHWLNGAMGRWIDRAVLQRRFDAIAGLAHVLEQVKDAATTPELADGASKALADVFATSVRVTFDAEPAPARSLPPSEGLAVPIPAGESQGALVLGERQGRVPWLSEDRALASLLAGVIGALAQNVRLRERDRELERRAQALELDAAGARLRALRAQVNPHFLFNALNAISGHIARDPALADQTVEQLAEVFRYTLTRSDREWVPLEEELACARAFLAVERARFGARLEVRERLDPSLVTTPVPPMLLLTLVENATKHGVAQVKGHAVVEITVARAGDRALCLEVADNGPGFALPRDVRIDERRDGAGFGLSSLRERVMGLFGEEGELRVSREDASGTTRVAVRLPLRQSDGIPAALEADRG